MSALRHLPNALTIGRLCMAPAVFGLILLNSTPALFAATALYMLGALSDLLDGRLARLLHAETPLGTNLDPIADKALVLAALGALGITDQLSNAALAATIAIGVRELIVGVIRLRLLRTGRPAPAGSWAKLKNLSQMAAAGVLLGLTAFAQVSERVREIGSSGPDMFLVLAALIGLLTLPGYFRLAKPSG